VSVRTFSPSPGARRPGRPPKGGWPAEHDAAVRDWAAGRLSLAAAMAKSGLSKGQICGRAYRMGLPTASAAERRANSPPAKRPAVQPAPLPAAGPLYSDGCQWPRGIPGKPGWHFCGAERASVKPPYCAAHVRAAMPGGGSDD
jgi:hypothetical protein